MSLAEPGKMMSMSRYPFVSLVTAVFGAVLFAQNLVMPALSESVSASTDFRRQDAERQALLAEAAADRLAYRDAARLYGNAARIIALIDGGGAREYRIKQASSLRSLGLESGDNGALLEAVNLFTEMLLECDRAKEPFQWARLQVWLGNAEMDLGEQEAGNARLEKALAAFRSALEEYTRDRKPHSWALTQNNLGEALRRLGQRESDPKHLEESIAAFRAALQERTRERAPLDWAMTQNNLGNSLSSPVSVMGLHRALGKLSPRIVRPLRSTQASVSRFCGRKRWRYALEPWRAGRQSGTAERSRRCHPYRNRPDPPRATADGLG